MQGRQTQHGIESLRQGDHPLNHREACGVGGFGEHRELLVANQGVAADQESDHQRLRTARRFRQLADGLGQRQTNRLCVNDVRHVGPTDLGGEVRGRPETNPCRSRAQRQA